MTFNEMILIVNVLVLKNKGKSINEVLTEYDDAFDKTIIHSIIITKNSETLYIKCKSHKVRNFTLAIIGDKIYYWLSSFGRWEKLNVPENLLEDIV